MNRKLALALLIWVVTLTLSWFTGPLIAEVLTGDKESDAGAMVGMVYGILLGILAMVITGPMIREGWRER